MFMKSQFSALLVSIFIISACGGGGGGGGGSAPVAPTPNISVTLSASANSADVNSSITLTWSSTLATSCSASGSWSGSKATSGSESITIGVGGSNTFSLSCSASGANSGNASTTVNGLRYFDGKVFDGYIRGAEVFVDTNNNSTLDSDETSVTTDNQGNFTKLLYADGSVISKGGIDLDTGADLSSLTLAHKMVGFEATKIISPITSLATYMAKPEDINAALGIDASIDLMSVDPIPNLGQSEYDYIYEKGNQLTVIAYSLQNSVNAINQTAETSQDYFLSIAEEIEKSYAASPGLVDIESNAFIEAVVENIIAKKASSMDATNKINMTSAISSVVPLIQVKSNAATTTAIQNFAFRTMQTDIQSLATGDASTGTIDNYSTNILTYISTDQNISSSDLEIDISALSDSASLDEDSSIEISPLTNDSYLRGQAVQLSIATSPANGSASLANEVITYTPDADWNGSESFTYSIVQGSKSATGTIEVTVAPINDAPVINAASEFSVNETIQSVATISATDVDQDDLTYSLSGTDAELFAISSTGVLTFVSSPDFENPADSDANNIYDLTVTVSDGSLIDEQAIAISILDVDDNDTTAPTISSFTFSPTSIDVSTQAQTVTLTADVQDEIGVTEGSNYRLYQSNSDSNTWITGSFSLSSGTAQNGTWTAEVNIPTSTGSGDWLVIMTGGFKDAAGNYQVKSADNGSTLTITNNPNQAPAFTSSATFSAAENQTAIGTVTATDADGDSLTYSISGSEINISSSGVLTFATAPDYETKNSYTATVTVSDGTDSVTQDITVNVTDVNEATNQPPVYSLNSTYIVNEGVVNVFQINATDPENDSLTVSLTGNDASAFAVSASGVVSFTFTTDVENPLDFNADTIFNITVNVSDGTTVVSQDINVGLSNVDEAGEIYYLYGNVTTSPQYLGCYAVNNAGCNNFSLDSVCNEFGTYGSEFNANSIWNEFGTFGSIFSSSSPWNQFANAPNTPYLYNYNYSYNYGAFSVNAFNADLTSSSVPILILQRFLDTGSHSQTRDFACN